MDPAPIMAGAVLSVALVLGTVLFLIFEATGGF